MQECFGIIKNTLKCSLVCLRISACGLPTGITSGSLASLFTIESIMTRGTSDVAVSRLATTLALSPSLIVLLNLTCRMIAK